MKKMKPQLTETPATKKLQFAIAWCSVIFTIGTTLHNFVIINTPLIETMMRMAGGDDPTGAAPDFTMWFRVVGCIYILGNALGILALLNRSHTLWWTVFAVNLTQALGFVMIPPSMWTATIDAYGIWGILPSAVTDGGALILVLVMVLFMVKYRTTWAQRRLPKR